MRRWVLDFGWFSLRVHHWYASDDHRAWHDHPWRFLTLVLAGSYTDLSPAGPDRLRAGSVRFRPALHRHTVQVAPEGCWTLLLTGSQVRRWGFWVPRSRGLKFLKANKYFWTYGHHPCESGTNQAE